MTWRILGMLKKIGSKDFSSYLMEFPPTIHLIGSSPHWIQKSFWTVFWNGHRQCVKPSTVKLCAVHSTKKISSNTLSVLGPNPIIWFLGKSKLQTKVTRLPPFPS